MAGKGRPGGNPELAQYEFKQQHSWSEPCKSSKTLRMPPLMAQFISEGAIPDWQEICRQAIASHLPAEKAAQLNWLPPDDIKEKA